MLRFQRLVLCTLAIALLAACDEPPVAPDPTVVVRIEIKPDSAVVLLGQEQSFTAKVFNALGAELTGRTIIWSSSNQNVAALHGEGTARALWGGTATIRASVEGVSASVPFRARLHPLKLTSYENHKEVGIVPTAIPLENVAGRTQADFYGDGTLALFTGRITANVNLPKEQGTPAEYTFWRRQGDRFVADNSILDTSERCMGGPRKVLIADFNQDKRPDLFLLCPGMYDEGRYPGERNQLLLSHADGKYRGTFYNDSAFWHGGAAGDLNGDNYPDMVLVGRELVVMMNNRDGTFREYRSGIPSLAYFTLELVDVDGDGDVDIVMGGHEWENAPTKILLNPGKGSFSDAPSFVVDAVRGEGVITDFVVTGTADDKTLWIFRTSGGDGTFYEGAALQRYHVKSRASKLVVPRRPGKWVVWGLQYTRDGIQYVGSDDPRIPLEFRVN